MGKLTINYGIYMDFYIYIHIYFIFFFKHTDLLALLHARSTRFLAQKQIIQPQKL